MVNRVELQKVVLAAIAGNLELGSEPDDSAGLFSVDYGVLDLVGVAVEVHGPLVEIAGSNLQQPHLPEQSRTEQSRNRGNRVLLLRIALRLLFRLNKWV